MRKMFTVLTTDFTISQMSSGNWELCSANRF